MIPMPFAALYHLNVPESARDVATSVYMAREKATVFMMKIRVLEEDMTKW